MIQSESSKNVVSMTRGKVRILRYVKNGREVKLKGERCRGYMRRIKRPLLLAKGFNVKCRLTDASRKEPMEMAI